MIKASVFLFTILLLDTVSIKCANGTDCEENFSKSHPRSVNDTVYIYGVVGARDCASCQRNFISITKSMCERYACKPILLIRADREIETEKLRKSLEGVIQCIYDDGSFSKRLAIKPGFDIAVVRRNGIVMSRHSIISRTLTEELIKSLITNQKQLTGATQ